MKLLKVAFKSVFMAILLLNTPVDARFIDSDYPKTVRAILDKKESNDDLTHPPKTFDVLKHTPGGQPFKEQWIYHQRSDYQSIEISYLISSTHYSESYSLLNRALIYASESEYTEYSPNSIRGLQISYFVKGGKLIHLSSTGHGKTEDDAWEPEQELMTRYKKRIQELQRLIRAHKNSN